MRATPVSRAYLVWGTGVFAYIIAVAGRTSLGVAGLQAIDRFDMSAAMLSTFVMVQLGVYAGAQLPAGVILDRIGSRNLITFGLFVLAIGQITLGLVTSVPTALVARVLIGLGDATIMISVIRLIPRWFAPRVVPLLTQLTGVLGQFGQIISAIPLFFVITNLGWTPAFAGLGVLCFLVGLCVMVLVQNRPRSASESSAPAADPSSVPLSTLEGLKKLVREPGAWLGLFVHYVTLFPANMFLLLWGVPFLTAGQHLSTSEVSLLLTICSVATFVIGPILGNLSARFPEHRTNIALGVVIFMVAGWVSVVIPSTPRPFWQLVILLVAISAGMAGCTIGFDFPRTLADNRYFGAASGMVNIGGYTASLVAVWVFGLSLDRTAASGHYDLTDFRIASLTLVPIMIVGLAGVFITRRIVFKKLGVRA